MRPIPPRRLLLLPVLAAAGCSSADRASHDEPAAPDRTDTAVVSPTRTEFDDAVLQAARDYKAWTRVTDTAQVAPTLCDAPIREGVQVSRGSDPDTHGRKLYFLFAKDANAYRRVDWAGRASHGMKSKPEDFISPVGQTLVKESWKPVEVPPDQDPRLFNQPDEHHPDRYARLGDRVFKATTQSDLFIMLKLDPSTPNTDQGWVYAVTSPDASRIIQAGRIESCMECHVKTDRDRLFGSPLYRDPPAAPLPAVPPAPTR